LTRRQEERRRHGQDPDEDDFEFNEDDDVDFEILQHLDAETREALNALPEDERERQLDALQIHLFETQGILFNQVATGEAPHHHPAPAGELDEDDGENNDENAGEDADQADDEEDDEADHDDHDHDGTFDEDDIASERYADDQSEDEEEVDEPTANEPTRDNHSFSGASFATNSSYVGSDVHERLANDFPGPFVNEPGGEVVVPATPEREALVGALELARQRGGGVPGAWIEDMV
jgi:hypothetical protein